MVVLEDFVRGRPCGAIVDVCSHMQRCNLLAAGGDNCVASKASQRASTMMAIGFPNGRDARVAGDDEY